MWWGKVCVGTSACTALNSRPNTPERGTLELSLSPITPDNQDLTLQNVRVKMKAFRQTHFPRNFVSGGAESVMALTFLPWCSHKHGPPNKHASSSQRLHVYWAV